MTLSALGLRRNPGQTATQTVANVLRGETGDRGTGSREMPFHERLSPEQQLDVLAERVSATPLGQRIRNSGLNVRAYLSNTLGNTKRAEIVDGVLQRRAISDVRKADMPQEKLLDSEKDRRHRRAGIAALWDIAEMRGQRRAWAQLPLSLMTWT